MTRRLSPFVLLALPLLALGQTGIGRTIPALRADLALRKDTIAAPQQDASGAAHAAVMVPRLQYRRRTLANGLTVYSIESHKSPNVAIQVSYRVGGENDPEGKSGFAHLFEHLMFKSTKNMKAEMMDRLTEEVGGNNNAFTTEDRTVYFETVPSNYLETLLWAEADRMANLNVDNANFLSERAVVEEEYRQSVLAPPYGRMDEYVNQHSFLVHPYRRGVIGSIANLDVANLEDVRRFHNVYYRPDNAVLVVSGDFDPAKLDAWIDQYFGRIPKPAGEVPRVTVQEPARAGEKRYNETGPNVPLPAVVINFLVPPAADADAAALHVAEVLLSDGRSSRLYQSLIYQQHVATQASGRADLRVGAGLFQFTTIAAGGKTVDEAERATLAEIDRLKTEPVSAKELDKARNAVVSRALQSRETAAGQAFALSEAAIISGDPERVNTDIARLQAVTAADIQRVAAKYFTPENRLVVRYDSGVGEQGGTSSAPTATTEAPSPITPTETPPPPSAPRRAVLPKAAEKTLANGLRVVVVPRPGTGLTAVSAVVKIGSVDDPANAAGLANFTASLLTRGTRSRSAAQIADEAESLGGAIRSEAGWDSSAVRLNVLSAHIADAMPLYADVIRNPAFAPEEVERLRSEELDDLTVSLRAPGALARYVASRVVFGDTAYGHQLAGTPESLKAIQTADVTDFYRAAYTPQQTVLVFGGDITPTAAFALAARFFGDWTGAVNRPVPRPVVVVRASPGGRVVVVDKPDAGQAAVLLVRSGIRRVTPNYEIARVANAVLGEGYSARLNQEIRVKRGLSYGASSRFDERQNGGLFIASAQTRNDAVPEVAALFETELTRLAAAEVRHEELVPRKAALSGNYSRSVETGAGLTSEVASLVVYGLPLSTLNTYLPRVQSVAATQVQEFAARDLSRTEASIVIVGDGRKFLTALRRKFPNTEIIPIADLDLNRGSLKK